MRDFDVLRAWMINIARAKVGGRTIDFRLYDYGADFTHVTEGCVYGDADDMFMLQELKPNSLVFKDVWTGEWQRLSQMSWGDLETMEGNRAALKVWWNYRRPHGRLKRLLGFLSKIEVGLDG